MIFKLFLRMITLDNLINVFRQPLVESQLIQADSNIDWENLKTLISYIDLMDRRNLEILVDNQLQQQQQQQFQHLSCRQLCIRKCSPYLPCEFLIPDTCCTFVLILLWIILIAASFLVLFLLGIFLNNKETLWNNSWIQIGCLALWVFILTCLTALSPLWRANCFRDRTARLNRQLRRIERETRNFFT